VKEGGTVRSALLVVISASLAAALAAVPAASPLAGVAQPAVAAPPGAAGAAGAGVNLVWTHTAADLESLAASALPIRFAIGGKLFDQALLIEKASDFRIEGGRLRVRVRGQVDQLGLPVEAEPVLTLRFDAVQAVHIVSLESLPVTLGSLGRLDLARRLGPWKIKPGQRYVIPVKGSAGIGMEVIIRKLDLTPAGLRVEAGVRYFPPPAAALLPPDSQGPAAA